MIIYGWRTRSSVRSTGSFRCSVCQSEQGYAIVGQRLWFTLYFLPIFPLQRGSEQVHCMNCGTSYDPSVLQRTLAMPAAAPRPHDFNPYLAAEPVGPGAPLAHSAAGRLGTSGLSISSLILGALSPLLLFTCFFSLVSSLLAIVLGHWALVDIRRSAGLMYGKWQAITGLLLGYATLLLTVGTMILLASQRAEAPRRIAANPLPSSRVASRVPELDLNRPAPATVPERAGGNTLDHWPPAVQPAAIDLPSTQHEERDRNDAPTWPPLPGPPGFDPRPYQAPPAPFEDGAWEPPPSPGLYQPRDYPRISPPGRTGASRPQRELPAFENKLSIERVREIPNPTWPVVSLAFSPDGERLAVGKIDQTVALFETLSGKLLHQSARLDDLGTIDALAFSHTGEQLVAGGSSGRTCLWTLGPSAQPAEARACFRHAGNASCVVASRRFPFFLTGGRDGTVVWQPLDNTSSPPRILQSLQRQVLAAHLPTQGTGAAVTDGRTLVRFSLRTAEETAQHTLRISTARAAAFSCDGERLAIMTGSEIQLFDTATGSLLSELRPSNRQLLWSLAFHPQQPHWLFSGGHGQVTLWDVRASEPLAQMEVGGVQYVKTMAVAENGNYFAAVPSSARESVRVFRLPEPSE